MPYLSFTRNREDVLIVRALGAVERGCYVDVGAYHPVTDSNTYALYLRGWRGMAIEPQEAFQPLWQEVRPGDVFIGAAAGERAAEVPFYEFSFSAQNATTDTRVAAMLESQGGQGSRRMISQVSLSELLAEHRGRGDIHLLSIDVEGAETAVLAGLDLSRFRPWLMVIESTVPNRFEQNFAGWEPAVLQGGYRFVYFDGVNRYYLAEERAELERHFSYPPCVWDDFVDHRLHLAEEAASAAQQQLAELRARLGSGPGDGKAAQVVL
jgi:FkbM family methyltransferase